MTVPGVMDMQYVYSATQNNGRITQSIDTVTGEQVSYQYDQLNRLMRAETADNAWGELYTYDGFGNLTAKTPTKGSAPALQVTFDPQTNRLYGPSYDANGNAGGSFDGENRLTGEPVGYGFRMAYDPWGKRIFRRDLRPTWDGSVESPPGPWEFYFYGITGQKLVTIHCEYEVEGSNTPTCRLNENLYFGSKMIKGNGTTITDRLGSVRADGTGQRLAYFPYGEDRVDTANGREKFGTYTRDGAGSASGLYSNYDYADQRYYDSIKGRFLSPDPGGLKSVSLRDPGSWNRYAYVQGDPVNFTDPTGQAGYCPSGTHAVYVSPFDSYCAGDTGSGSSGGDYNGMETVNSGDVASGGGGSAPTPAPKERPKRRPPAPCDSPIMQSQYLTIFGDMGRHLGVDSLFVMSLALQESGWNLSHVYGTNAASNGQPLNNLFGSTYAGGNNIAYPTVRASADAWEENWGPYLSGHPKSVQGFVDALTSDPKHMYNVNPDWKASIAGGTLANGRPTRGTYNTLLREFEDCGIAIPGGR